MDNLGLDDESMVFYIKNEYTRLADEYVNTKLFLQEYQKHFASENRVHKRNVEIRFINWGMEALVFVLSCKEQNYTLLVGQPRTEFGLLKQQSELLTHFNKIDSSVIAPIEYFTTDSNVYKKELIVTPYVYQARCISTLDAELGMYVPEPKYHFTKFKKDAQSIIKSCIIAKLVSCYDQENNMGLGDVQILSGDFILDKSYKQNMSYEQTLEKLSLIACRNTVKCSLNEYLDLLKTEFTVNTRQGQSLLGNENFKVSTNFDSPLTLNEVEKGIELGLELRSARETQKTLPM